MFKVLSLVFLLKLVAAKSLVDIINACDINDPNFEKCCVDEGNRVLPIFVNGIENVSPKLSPYNFSPITYDEGDYVIDLHDGQLRGLETFKLTGFRFAWNRKKLIVEASIDKLELKSPCKIVGRVLDKSLNGNGTIKIAMENVKFAADFFVAYTKKEDQLTYIKKVNNNIFLSSDKVKFNIAGVFGDEAKDNELNGQLNGNADQTKKELVPIVEKICVSILEAIQAVVTPSTPLNQLFKNAN